MGGGRVLIYIISIPALPLSLTESVRACPFLSRAMHVCP